MLKTLKDTAYVFLSSREAVNSWMKSALYMCIISYQKYKLSNKSERTSAQKTFQYTEMDSKLQIARKKIVPTSNTLIK